MKTLKRGRTKSLEHRGSTDTLHYLGTDAEGFEHWTRRGKGESLSRCKIYNEKRKPVGPARFISFEFDFEVDEDEVPYGQRLADGFGVGRWGDAAYD